MDSPLRIRRLAIASGGSEGRLFRQEICLLSLKSRDTKAIGSMFSIAITLNIISRAPLLLSGDDTVK
jgi:hypothetical protein